MLKKDKKDEWKRMEEWLESIGPKKKLIGIGGNIRSLIQSSGKKELLIKEFNKKTLELSRLSTKEKIAKYNFSPDRADVIDHALNIFQVVAQHLAAEVITASKWGISDSIAVKLFHELYSAKINISSQ